MNKIIVIISFLIGISSFSQGPIDGYGKGKGNFAIGTSFNREKNGDFFAGSNTIFLPRNIQSYSLFGIYGITNKLDVQLNIPYVNLNSGQEQNFHDGSIYLKYKVLNNKNKLGSLDIFGATGFYQPLSDYEVNGGSAIGQQNNAIDARVVIQQNFKKGLFVSLQSGHFWKTNPTPNAILSSLKVGFANSKIYADIFIEHHESLGGTDYLGTGTLDPATRGGFISLGIGYTRIGGTVYKNVYKNFGAFVGGSYTVSGRNIGKATRIGLGIVYNFYKK